MSYFIFSEESNDNSLRNQKIVWKNAKGVVFSDIFHFIWDVFLIRGICMFS